MATLVQMAGNALAGQLENTERALRAAASRIEANTRRIAALAQRGADGLAPIRKDHDFTRKTFANSLSKFAGIAKQAREWMQSHGLTSSSGLSGVPLVPLAIAAGFAVAIAAYKWADARSTVESKWLDALEKAIAAKGDGRLSGAEFDHVIDSLSKQAKARQPGNDLLGVQSIAEALPWVAAAVIALTVGKPLLESMLSGRRSERAA